MRVEQTPIKRLAEERGIRHVWVAERLGVSPWMFNHIEAGRRKAPRGYYERAAELFGVPIEWVKPDAEPIEVPA